MFGPWSPPKHKNSYVGGSNVKNSPISATSSHTSLGLLSSNCRSNSLQSFNSCSTTAELISDASKNQCTNYVAQNTQQNAQHVGRASRNSSFAAGTSKRTKRHWANKDRAGMSFLIVIAFFAIFGLIILTEIFMIDERSHAGMIVVRHGSTMGRLGDSMPDYDNVKDDYDVLEDNLLSDNKLGYVQGRDNKFKVQEADNSNNNGRLTGVLLNTGVAVKGMGMSIGVGGIGAAANMPIIPWGKVLPPKIEESLPHFPLATEPTDGSWQIVNGTRFKFFVFSAYYDRRDGAKLIRVIGATKTRGPERVWCRFWYFPKHNSTAAGIGGRNVTSITVMARVKVIRENWNLKYSACFVLCPVRTPELQVPDLISIVSRLRTPPGNLLMVRNTDWDADFLKSNKEQNSTAHTNISSMPQISSLSSEQIPDKIAVCVKPFHFNYDQALFLMEYLEFYALLGVSHFTFYNHTIGPHAACVLTHYQQGDIPVNLTAWDEEPLTPAELMKIKENGSFGSTMKAPKHLYSDAYVRPTVTILPWNLRMRSQKEIRTEGLFAALNDCVYRSMYRYRYLALVDLDEFIIPRYNDTLMELINSLNQRFRNRFTGAYSFQNAFFYLQFPDDNFVKQETTNPNVDPRIRAALVTQRKTKRRLKLHPQKQRSKYICKPEAVVEAGNHFVWEFSPNKGSLNVPPTEAILQHYRVCEFGGNDCIKAPSVVDRTATKYVNRLVQRVNIVYEYLKDRCRLPDLPAFNRPDHAKAVSTKPRNETNQTKGKSTNLSQTTLRTDTSIKSVNSEFQTVAPIIRTIQASTNVKQHDFLRRQHKLIVFEEDIRGVMNARVEYKSKTRT